MPRPTSITFVYLGRGAAFSTFVLELAAAARRHRSGRFEFVVADGSELADRLQGAGAEPFRVATFQRTTPLQIALGFLNARRRLADRLAETRPDAVVTLMPHVWSPLITPRIKRLGIRYATIVHDAVPHPGDPTAWATSWLLRDIRHADVVLTLSRTVAEEIASRDPGTRARTTTLFHPDLLAGGTPRIRCRDSSRPFRILFFGRIMAYKGLPLLIEAVELLRAEGVPVELGVAGRGPLGPMRERLAALGAEVVNTWLADNEVTRLLSRYDAMACSHIEASQSGVAALAFGNGMPVVATPVGGVAEQVVPGKTGILANGTSARALASAIRQLISVPGLYDSVTSHLFRTQPERSMDRFLEAVVAAVAPQNAIAGREPRTS